MKKIRGQALIEFILILPVFLLIVLGTFDMGKIIYEKYCLQNHLDVIKDLYQQKQDQEIVYYLNKNGIMLAYEENGKYMTLVVSKQMKIMTPGLQQILTNPYTVKESITIYHETQS